MRALVVALALSVTTPASAACKPLVDIVAEGLLAGANAEYEAIPFALVADLTTIYNALPPPGTDNFDGAIAATSGERTIIMLTRGVDVCGTMPPIPAPAWAVLHKRIFGVMA